MRLSFADLSPDDLFDVCIVGTGPAGMTCALALEGAGDPYFELDSSRLRYLGGTSNHWGGMCRPLDAMDFAPKEGFPDTGWPIGKADLDPYLPRAAEILEIPEVPPSRPLPGGELKQVEFVFSPPVRFAGKFGARIDASDAIFLVLDANLVDLETNGPDITGARVVNRAGARRTVRARQYVLATGGIENSRLLLWSNARNNGQIVKHAEALGKYWIEHPHFTVGEAILTGGPAFPPNGRGPYRYLAPTEQAVRAHGILNCGLRILPFSYEGVVELIADIACVAPDWGRWAFRRLLGGRLICGAVLKCAWEQAPRAENRVELGGETDALGMPRPRLHWRKSAVDRRTPRVVAEALGAYLAETDAGRVRLWPWILGDGDFPGDHELGGHHHMGGTRMAETPASGVVDRNCKVFGQSNLYVAGSSVFPSSGHANPTLTIVQLALRLADHLGARL